MRLAVIYIGFNNPRGHKRGVENVIEIQAQALQPGSRKYYIFFDNEDSITRWADVTAVGISYSPLQFLRVNLIIGYLIRRLRKKGFRVLLHSHHYLVSLCIWWKTDIFTVHDGLWYQKQMVGSRIPWVFFLIEKWVYWRSRFLQCNSTFTLKTSLLAATRRPVTVIFCTTPLERLHEEACANPLRVVPKGARTVLSVRSIEVRARIDLIMEVASMAQERAQDLAFVIAGKGPLLAHYRREVQARGIQNVQLLGYVSESDLARLYAGSDIVLMLCEYGEGFGIPAIEGYLFGKPVIASNRCAVPEVAFSSGCLVENNAEMILSKLSEAPSLTVALMDYYDRNFSNKVIVAQFRKMYDTVCGN